MLYRREIDGLRAIAVIAVIGFHAGFPGFGGGYVGVDIFFVISGYLITGILVDDLATGTFSIARFYERRARRILPALFLVMFCCLPLAWLWMLPSELKDFSQSLFAATLFASNILFVAEDGYFADAAEMKPLLHSWSLSVEEQFYLLFPICLLMGWRLGQRRLFGLVFAVALVSLVASEWMGRVAPGAAYFLASSRVWEFLAGALCALPKQSRVRAGTAVFGLTGLGLILFAIFCFDSTMGVPGLYALVPVGGTVLILLFGGEGTLVARLLGAPVCVGIGLMSYSTYLWHQPLFAFARLHAIVDPSPHVMLALALASFALAYVSWRYVETPFRAAHLAVQPRRGPSLVAGAALAAGFVGLGLAGHVTRGFEHLWLRSAPASVAKAYYLFENARTESAIYTPAMRKDDGACIFNAGDLSHSVRQRLARCRAKNGPGLLIFGDSHATNLFNSIFASNNGRLAFIVGLTKNGCHLPKQRPDCPYGEIAQLVRSSANPFAVAIYERAGRTMRRAEATERIWALPGAADDIYDQQLIEGTTSYLATLSAAMPVIWFGPRLEAGISPKAAVKRGCSYAFRVPDRQYRDAHWLDAFLKKASDRASGLTYISQIARYKVEFPRDYLTCQRTYWVDETHFSPAGEIAFGKRFDFIGYLKAKGLVRPHATRP